MKEKKMIISVLAAAMMTAALYGCGDTAQNYVKDNAPDVTKKTEAATEAVADGEQYYVSSSGVSYTKEQYRKLIERAAFSPDDIASLSPEAAQAYKDSPAEETGTTAMPADSDEFYINSKGVSITYGEYKALLDTLTPDEINALDKDGLADALKANTAEEG